MIRPDETTSFNDTRSAVSSATRRKILIALSQLATAAILASCDGAKAPPATIPGASDLELLAGVAYDILPYPEVPVELYLKVAHRIMDLKDKDLAPGLKRLRDASHGQGWKDVTEPERLAILSSVQDTSFFHMLRSNTLQVLLRDPAVYALVGYGGPSIQYGGYLERGFSNISWLPAARGN